MTTTKNNIPVGYKDSAVGIIPQEWEVKLLGELCENISSGNNKHKGECGKYRVYGSTGIIGYSDTYSYDHPTILIARVGANAGTINKGEGKYDVSDNTLIICNNKIVYDHNFAYNQLTNYNLNKLIFGSGQPLVTAGQLKKIKLPVPPLAEQRKIAEILEIWDEAIEKQSRLIERLEVRKRGLMQRLLTGKTRLPGFTEPWQKVKFKQIFEKKNITFEESNTTLEILSVTKEGVMSQKEYFSKDIASEDISKYKLVERGDLAMSGLNFWMGSCHILTEYDRGLISPAYKVFCVNYNYNLPFIIHFVRGHAFKYSLIGCSVVGASIVRRNLDKEMLNEWIYLIPSLSEQKAIAEVLNTADKEIAIHSKTLDALRLQKRGLMQQLLTGKTRVKI